MSDSRVTIVAVPRERFSLTKPCLERLYAVTPSPFGLVYVDGGSPARIQRYLEAQAEQKGFLLVRTDRHLWPNQARNLGLRYAEGDYVVFIDNDILVTPGWLAALVRCADETGAWVVGPIVCYGQTELETVHVADGHAHFLDDHGTRLLHEEHRLAGKRLRDVLPHLRRTPCGFVEFHCVLIRTSVFKRLGPLDEALLSTREYLDFCLSVQNAGGTIVFEPESIVTHILPRSVKGSDLRFFLSRWSEAANQATLDYFQQKWQLKKDDPHITRQQQWLRGHRQLALAPIRSLTRKVLGWRLGSWLNRRVLCPMEQKLNRFLSKGLVDGRGLARVTLHASPVNRNDQAPRSETLP